MIKSYEIKPTPNPDVVEIEVVHYAETLGAPDRIYTQRFDSAGAAAAYMLELDEQYIAERGFKR